MTDMPLPQRDEHMPPIDPDLLYELWVHDQCSYGPWTNGLRHRVEDALGIPHTPPPLAPRDKWW